MGLAVFRRRTCQENGSAEILIIIFHVEEDLKHFFLSV